jgi:hypothetical protein
VIKEKLKVQSSRTRDIRCFKCLGLGHISSQCPNRRTMVVKKRVVQTDSEEEEEETIPIVEEDKHDDESDGSNEPFNVEDDD